MLLALWVAVVVNNDSNFVAVAVIFNNDSNFVVEFVVVGLLGLLLGVIGGGGC